MKRILKLTLLPVAIMLLVVTSCSDVLEVENKNNPDITRVLSNGDDVEALVAGAFNTIYIGEHSFSGVQMPLATASDNISCSWGNQAMRDMSWEPRNNAWNNAPSYSYRGTTKFLFDQSYAAIGAAVDGFKAIEGGVDVGTDGERNARTIAFGKFVLGVAYGDLAAVFDRVFIIDDVITVDADISAASDYKVAADAAVAYLDEAIALATANSFTVPATWLGTANDMSSADFIKLCNTYAARILAYTPRNGTDLAAVDWAVVKSYADAGITSDFTIINDAYTKWYHEAGDYLTYSGWGVTDMYVVNMMDPTQPQHWTDDAAFAHPPESTNPIDDRMTSDFDYLASNWFLASRGYYHYSNYRHSRYDAFYVNADGPRTEIFKAENDMLKAEARVYLNDLAGAATIINASSRVLRGGMADVAAVKADLIKAIHHERHVELYATGMGLQFFEMRKLDLLQEGTPLHLPLPAQTLETLRLAPPFYTFGTVANADGVNTSNGGWR